MDHRKDFGAVNMLSVFLILSVAVASCKRSGFTRFLTVDPDYSGIHFNNKIVENDSVNLLGNENVYNGGGAGIGDFDNNGLPDILLAGNMVDSRLYLNKGNFRFLDITDLAGIVTKGRWCRGVAVTDINNDGWPDIYISATQKVRRADRKNLLFINQGLGPDKIPHFIEDAESYGLADDSHTTQAYFFDYDNDGDNDVYLVVNEINDAISPYHFRYVMKNGSNPSTGKLLRNDYDSLLKHPVFTDVSHEAGIQKEGYGHSAVITDINMDGWKDIVVGNDFITNDLMWINNGNGTFTDEMKLYFKHTSANTMGSDAADINNDGLTDFVFLDMNPEDNYRKKMMLPPNAYQLYQNTERYGYSYQYVRNTLQLNQGFYKGDDSVSRPLFSEAGFYAGIYATDWSWTPMFNDFDNDGDRDLIISNGFPKDITDHDFAMYRQNAYYTSSPSQLLGQIPVVKLHNYAFRNNSDLIFSDVSEEWGMTTETFSNGSAYADFDNDGDVDIIMNNINDEALLLRNYTIEKSHGESGFIRVSLQGSGANRKGIGARVEIYYDNGKMQVCDNYPFRGYLSSVEDKVHFGIGSAMTIDSMIVRWPDGKVSIMKNLPSGKTYVPDIHDAVFPVTSKITKQEGALFKDITSVTGIRYLHRETDFVDF
ncbi:MAG TPA: CRTAC1 family protein, partial [Bacteroidales bacterium]|nr:CRTAC1 family protein [Bacteroidales bacterium]